jgi:hypothetical protein
VIGVAVTLNRRCGGQSGSEIGRLLDALDPTFITCSLLVIAAIVLILGHKDLLVPALVAVLVGGVVNAWLILVRLTDCGGHGLGLFGEIRLRGRDEHDRAVRLGRVPVLIG